MAAEEQLVAVEEAMVRKKKGVHSSLAGFPEGHKLPVGAVVTVLERAECDGHARVRIGKKRWVSRETAQGRVLLMPVAEAGAQGEIAGEGGAQAEVAAGGAAEKSRWMKWWCRLLLMAASGFVGFFAGWFVGYGAYKGSRSVIGRSDAREFALAVWGIVVLLAVYLGGWKVPKKLARRAGAKGAEAPAAKGPTGPGGGDPDAELVSEASGAAKPPRWTRWWCRLLTLAAGGVVGFFASIFVFVASAAISKILTGSRNKDEAAFLGGVAFVAVMIGAWKLPKHMAKSANGANRRIAVPKMTEMPTEVDEYQVVQQAVLRSGPGLHSPIIKKLEPKEKVGLFQQLPDLIDGHIRCKVVYAAAKDSMEMAWLTLHTEGEPKVPDHYRLRTFLISAPTAFFWSFWTVLFAAAWSLADMTYTRRRSAMVGLFIFGAALVVTAVAAFAFDRRRRHRVRMNDLAILEATGDRMDVPTPCPPTVKNQSTRCVALCGANPRVPVPVLAGKVVRFAGVAIVLIVVIYAAFVGMLDNDAFCNTPMSDRWCENPRKRALWRTRKRERRFGRIETVERSCDRNASFSARQMQLTQADGCGCEPGQAWREVEKDGDWSAERGQCVSLADYPGERTDLEECITCGQSGSCLPLPEERGNASGWTLQSNAACHTRRQYGWRATPTGNGRALARESCLEDAFCDAVQVPAAFCPSDTSSSAPAPTPVDSSVDECGCDIASGDGWCSGSLPNRCSSGCTTSAGECDGSSSSYSDRHYTYTCISVSHGRREDQYSTCVFYQHHSFGDPPDWDVCQQNDLRSCEGSWGAWSDCRTAASATCVEDGTCAVHNAGSNPHTCGPGGTRYRSFSKTSDADAYGEPCEAEDGETQFSRCNDHPCPACAAGRYSASSSEELGTCTACDPGKVAGFGLLDGSFRTLGPCITCPMGQYANANATDCINCAPGKHTVAEGTASQGVGLDPCQECAKPNGYEACLGGVCHELHQGDTELPDGEVTPVGAPGTLCGVCTDGYYLDGVPPTCVPCGTGWFTIIAVLFLAVVSVSGVTYIIVTFLDVADHLARAQGDFDLWMAFSLGMGQMQRLLQVITINWSFPQSWVDFANMVREYVDFDFPSLAQPECQIKLTPVKSMLLRTSVMAATLPAIWCLVALGILLEQRKSRKIDRPWMVLFEIGVALHSVLFVVLLKAGLAPFDCTQGEGGFPRLDKNGGVACDTEDEDFASLRLLGFAMLLIFGVVFPLLHLPNWVETIGLASKMVIVMVTTFMSSADYAWLALLILMMSAAGFSALGFYLRRNCGMGFRVVQIGAMIEFIGYMGGQYFVWCAPDSASVGDVVENDLESCTEGLVPILLGVLLGSCNIGFFVWAVWVAIREEATHTDDDPSLAKEFTVTADATIRADKLPTAEVLGELQVGTHVVVWEDSSVSGQISVELERDGTGLLVVGLLACKQLVSKDIGGNDVVVEVRVNGRSKRTNVKPKTKADAEFQPEDGEIQFKVIAKEEIATTEKVSVSSGHVGKLQPGEIVTVYEQRESGGHVRVRMDGLAEENKNKKKEKKNKSRWATRHMPTGEELMEPAEDVPGARLRFESIDQLDELVIRVVDVDHHLISKDTEDDVGTVTLVSPDGAGALGLDASERGGKWEEKKTGWFQLKAPEGAKEAAGHRFLRITSTGWVNDPWHAIFRKHEWLELTSTADDSPCAEPSAESTQPILREHRVEVVKGQRGYENKWSAAKSPAITTEVANPLGALDDYGAEPSTPPSAEGATSPAAVGDEAA